MLFCSTPEKILYPRAPVVAPQKVSGPTKNASHTVPRRLTEILLVHLDIGGPSIGRRETPDRLPRLGPRPCHSGLLPLPPEVPRVSRGGAEHS